ncbi:putative bifunctional diguanylate cyclase/phosphodiesterase [Noviherbaspirillum autotrophicum]|uniref:putative bifunctional diguanylate cyclase/phosphodiesterase n=1 Tax=Noviherbaspirillum autotrophicum TaxID=709839 RepID=UPI00069459B3|nr:EAL domain-containing protein [Noviherbaspirillum autotrophicum]
MQSPIHHYGISAGKPLSPRTIAQPPAVNQKNLPIMEDIELYKRRLAQEISARLQAESLLRQQSVDLPCQGMEPEQAMRAAAERDRLLVQLAPDAILLECEGRIVFVNPAAVHLYRASSAAELLGRSLHSLVAPAYRGLAPAAGVPVHDAAPRAAEEQALCVDGELIDIAVTRQWINYLDKPALYMVANDISERKRQETQLLHQATHDALTGLPNRNLLVDRLQLAIAEAKRYQERFVVAFIDLDRFKWINDNYGHETGDALLITVSERMSACLRESDTIARLGGDEFVLVLRDSVNGGDSVQVLKRVVDCVSMPTVVDGQEIRVTCSMGCCTYPDDGEEPEALLRFSDVAMYRAKENGRNSVQHYNEDLRHRFGQRGTLANELRHALERGQFSLRYQLQLDLKSGAVAGMEALLRWHHPELGEIEPHRFLPIAEETGLIEPIGEWVLHHACRQNRLWQDAGLQPLRVAVNLSPRELARPGLAARIAQSLRSTGLDPEYLELELTESASMQMPDKTLQLMQKLRDLGVGLSIDHFGTGYSNMHYLQRFPVEKLKLDGSFIRHIETDTARLAITDAVVSVAHRFGMKVIAEMAETEHQVAVLAACGCDQAQGFYFSQPVDADACAQLLRSYGSRDTLAAG